MASIDRKLPSRREIESRALIYAGIVMLASLMLTIFIFSSINATTFDIRTVGFDLSLCVAGAAAISFIIGYRNSQDNFRVVGNHLAGFRRFLAISALSFGHAAISFLSIAAASYLIANVFPKMTIDALSAAIITSFVVSLASYIVYLRASRMSANKLAGILTFFVISGTLTSIITSDNKQWWQDHFSALGTGGSLSSYTFNLTIIIGGILMVSLADYIVSDFQKIQRVSGQYAKINASVVRALFMIIGVAMIGVGIFPYNMFRQVHDISADIMTLTFCILMMTLPMLVPIFSRAFIALSYISTVLVVGSYWLFREGKLQLVAMEVASAMTLFLWLIVFLRQVSAVYVDAANSSSQKRSSDSGKNEPDGETAQAR